MGPTTRLFHPPDPADPLDLGATVDALIGIARAGDPHAARHAPGADERDHVCRVSIHLHRAPVLARIAALPVHDRASFARALAGYEASAGGLGSVTALRPVLGLFGDDVALGYEVFAWIVETTDSLRYYADRAVGLVEPDVAAVQRDAMRAEAARRNDEAAAAARTRRAGRATEVLYQAVRRGDVAAVRALLARGADPTTRTPTGEALIGYARASGHDEIAVHLEAARDARRAS